MFINAGPRSDLHGFRSFVPMRIVELSYHWPNSMTNYGTNVWGNLKPVSSPEAALGAWAYRSDAASDSESYSDPLVQNTFSQTSDAVPSYSQPRIRNRSTLAAPKRIEYPQPQLMHFDTQSPHDVQELLSHGPEMAMQLAGANPNSHDWNTSHHPDDASRFSLAQYSPNAFSFGDQPSLEEDDTTSMIPSVSYPSSLALYNTTHANDSFGGNDIEMGSMYRGPFEQSVVPSPSMAVSFTPGVHSGFNGGRPWHDTTKSPDSIDPCGMALPFVYDGVPHSPPTLWPSQSGPRSTWPTPTVPPETISPQALSLVVPLSSPFYHENSPRSSSEWHSETNVKSEVFRESACYAPYSQVQSVRTTDFPAHSHDSGIIYAKARPPISKVLETQNSSEVMADSKFRPSTSQGFGSSSSLTDNAHANPQSATSQRLHRHRSASETQYLTTLPVKSKTNNVHRATEELSHHATEFVTPAGPQNQKSAGIVQSHSGRILRPRRKLPSEPKNDTSSRSISSSFGVNSRSHKGQLTNRSKMPGSKSDDAKVSLSNTRLHSVRASGLQRPLGTGKTETNMTEVQLSGSTVQIDDEATLSVTEDIADHRRTKDRFLLDSKRDGKSYKQIRQEGGFTEAESTLRGRHRALTKKPEERVRKPTWEANDIYLLKKAVHKLAGDSSSARPKKVSWKQVSDFIVDNDGSYRFGNSTCRKKWSELYARSSDQDLS